MYLFIFYTPDEFYRAKIKSYSILVLQSWLINTVYPLSVKNN